MPETTKTKTIEILTRTDFEYLLIETQDTINHIKKVAPIEKIGAYFWVVQTKNGSEMPRTFCSAESLVHELHAWLNIKTQTIMKMTTMLVYIK